MTDEKIIGFIKGELSPEDKSNFLDWIDEMPENKEYYGKLRQLWNLAVLSGEYDISGNKNAYARVKRKISEKKQTDKTKSDIYRIALDVMKFAAVILITFGISRFVFNHPETESPVGYHHIEVPTGQRVKLSLSDGSTVWLNAGTKFTYPEKFSNADRMVSLNGEALFDVQHDEKHPFTVQTSTYSVKVLGTKFNVYAYDESSKLETTLFNGSIIMQKDNNIQNDITLYPGQQAVFDKNTTTMAVYSGMDTTEINSWIYGYHVFNKTPFRDMIERLSHYYEKKITVKLPEILDYECTGKFRHEESLEHILNVVKISKPFRYKETNKEIVIY